MKTFFVFFLICHSMFAQESYHDPALDSINGSVGNVDADLNGYLSQQLTMYQLNTNSTANGQFIQTNNGNIVISNALFGTNALQINSSISNLSSVFGSVLNTNPFSGFNDATVSPSNGDYTISMGSLSGQNFSMDLGLNYLQSYIPTFQTVGSNLRGLILAIFSFVVLIWEMDYVTQYAKELFSAKQTSGSTQEIFGTNASAPIGLAYSALLTGLIVAAVGFCVSYFLTGHGATQIASVQTVAAAGSSFTTSMPLWPIITSFLPVSGLIVIAVNYLLFRYVLTYPVFIIVHTVVLFFIV